ncbi:unnamed protein product [Diatraea saccharalis]|uniref:FLYWCH-type domain-containing protein n=1 Tax=Diatraea saccharalis TaxID=40085 RepID=A0A9N9WCH9_9NEOP|nr:unnamed protein product [Diatraea saccharalis]
MFVRNHSGKQLAIVNGHKYYCGNKGAKNNIWRCTRWGNCKSRFIMTVTGEMVDAYFEHTHDSPNSDGCQYSQAPFTFDLLFINFLDDAISVLYYKNKKGKDIAVVDGYTFYSDNRKKTVITWQCTRSGMCHSRFTTTKCGKVIRFCYAHSHDKPRFTIHDVQFVKNRRGQAIIVAAGHTFYRQREQLNSNYWWCTFGTSCKARIITNKGARKGVNSPCLMDTLIIVRQLTISAPEGEVIGVVQKEDRVKLPFQFRQKTPLPCSILMIMKQPMTWVQHRNGKQAVIVNGFTYYCNKQGHKTDIWRCTNGSNCRARFTMSKTDWKIVRVTWMTTEAGKKIALYQDYTFYNYANSGITEHWRCTSHTLRNQPFTWTKRHNGKDIALINGYSFYMHERSSRTAVWRCSKGSTCKARFTAMHDGTMPRLTRCRKNLTEEQKKMRRREQKKLSSRRARAKMDETALEERRKKDREKYKRAKDQGALKTIKDCTPQEQIKMRKLWREKAKQRRKKVKE